jgi:hypothetical protein
MMSSEEERSDSKRQEANHVVSVALNMQRLTYATRNSGNQHQREEEKDLFHIVLAAWFRRRLKNYDEKCSLVLWAYDPSWK